MKNKTSDKRYIHTNITNNNFINIKNTFVSYGYKFTELNEYEILLILEANNSVYHTGETAASILMRSWNKDKFVKYHAHGEYISYAFKPDEDNIYIMKLDDIELINHFINAVKYNHKQRCCICSSKTRIFKECGRCNGSLCVPCFDKVGITKTYQCPFCRYTLNNHINENIKRHDMSLEDCFLCKISTV